MAATIVGVMPEGFGFPVNQRIWMPLRVDGSVLAPRTGPGVSIFGRLAPGASMEDAQAELDVIGARMAASYPETHRNLSPRVTPYAKPLTTGGEALLIRNILYVVNVVFLTLLAVMCTNVATLVFARTATRSWEIAVRNALGASRGRIVSQLFIEALVLAGGAAVLGLVVARVAMGWGTEPGGRQRGAAVLDRRQPLVEDRAVCGAAHGDRRHDRRRAAGAAGHEDEPAGCDAQRRARGSGLKFGGFWTTVIVVQVAITVAFLPLAAGGVYRVQPVQSASGRHRCGEIPDRQREHRPRRLRGRFCRIRRARASTNR